jgi:hypothetical protein
MEFTKLHRVPWSPRRTTDPPRTGFTPRTMTGRSSDAHVSVILKDRSIDVIQGSDKEG